MDVLKLIQQFKDNRFWGELDLKFQDGEIVHARKVESLNIPKPQPNRTERKQYEPR